MEKSFPRRGKLLAGARAAPERETGGLLVDDERLVVAVVGGVEELVGEGEALLGADFGALAALDALGDEDADFLGALDEIDGVGGAHLLAAETADTLSVIIYRRLSFAFSEIHSFSRNRTALHTDPAADTFISFYIWFFLKNV